MIVNASSPYGNPNDKKRRTYGTGVEEGVTVLLSATTVNMPNSTRSADEAVEGRGRCYFLEEDGQTQCPGMLPRGAYKRAGGVDTPKNTPHS